MSRLSNHASSDLTNNQPHALPFKYNLYNAFASTPAVESLLLNSTGLFKILKSIQYANRFKMRKYSSYSGYANKFLVLQPSRLQLTYFSY